MVKMASIGYQRALPTPQAPQDGGNRLSEGIGNGEKGRRCEALVYHPHRQKPQTKTDKLCSGIPEEQLFLSHIMREKAETSAEKCQPDGGDRCVTAQQTEKGKGASPHAAASRAETVEAIDEIVGVGEKEKPQKGGGDRKDPDSFQPNSAKDGKKGGGHLPCQFKRRCEPFGIVPHTEADDDATAEHEEGTKSPLGAQKKE